MRPVVVLLWFVPCALAHENEPLQPHDVWRAWSWDPLIVFGLAVSAFLYWRGAARAAGITRGEAFCYWTGWMLLLLALLSPIHAIGEVLFSAHMIQHELIMAAAAPLIVLGRPGVAFLWAFSPALRKRIGAGLRTRRVQVVWAFVGGATAAWLLHFVVLWVWHLPVLFEGSVQHDWIHALQHLSFLFSALLFWWALISVQAGRRNYGVSVFYLFTTGVHTSILGALLTFSPAVWYPVYAETTAAWKLAPLEDQQLGGLIMWIPAGLAYLIATLAVFRAWMRESEIRLRTREEGSRA